MATALENPYIGPRPFQREDRERFFGRTSEIAILRSLVLSQRVNLLFAQSGAGKSSLLEAGLIPSLIGSSRSTLTMLPILRVSGGVPSDVGPGAIQNIFVYYTLSKLFAAYPDRASVDLAATTIADGLALLPAVDTEEDDPPPDPLLIFDQFEELFTTSLDRWLDREGFFRQLREALERHPGLRILFSMREDYIAELTPYLGFLPDRLRSRFRLEQLREAAAHEAIVRPAGDAQRPFDDAAARLLIERLRSPAMEADAPAHAAVLSEFVEPVQLQVVCRYLWGKLDPAHDRINQAHVEAFANVQAALTDFYQQTIEETLRQAQAQQSALTERRLRAWFDQLITPNRTRSLIYKGATSTGGLPNPVVDLLDQSHLIRPLIRGGDTWYELSHDRMVAPILRSNQEWHTHNSPDWLPRADRWDAEHRPASLLLSADELRLAEQSNAKLGYQPAIGEVAFEFLQESRFQIERAQKERDRQAERGINLADTGWAAIFAQDDPQAAAIQQALGELLQWRRRLAPARCKLLSGPSGYLSGESWQGFVRRAGVAPGAVNYDKLPRYLLLVGGPELIPFEFQIGLQAEYIVGRVAFDTLEEYARYARSVARAEDGSFALPPQRALFRAPMRADPEADAALAGLFSKLSSPSAAAEPAAPASAPDQPAAATRDDLYRLINDGALLSPPDTVPALRGVPALLVSAGAGLAIAGDDPARQRALQGALYVSSDASAAESQLSAAEVSDEARLLGSIGLLYHDYSAGTPESPSYPEPAGTTPAAGQPFIARLPQRLLGHPRGGMLAVIGHVDAIRRTRFSWEGQTFDLSDALGLAVNQLTRGNTVGLAFQEIITQLKQTTLSLAEQLRQAVFYRADVSASDLAPLHEAIINIRSLVILGDPAARLPLDGAQLLDDAQRLIAPVAGFDQLHEMVAQPAASIEPPGFDTPKQLDQGPQTADVLIEPGIFYSGGVNGTTGEYLLPPMTGEELAAFIRGEAPPANLSELKARYRAKIEGSF